MFSLLRTPLPASAVECSLACNLVSPSETSLVTAGADVLRVFRLRPHAGIAPGEKIAHVVLFALLHRLEFSCDGHWHGKKPCMKTFGPVLLPLPQTF